MSKLFIHECGGNLGNMTNEIVICEPVDFALVINNKSYRMQADRDGNLMVSLINGVDAKFIVDKCYPTIKLVSRESAIDYDYLKRNYKL